jgi:hypothetical protein
MPYEFHVQTPVKVQSTGACVHCGKYTDEGVVYQHALFPLHHVHFEELTPEQRRVMLQAVLVAAKAEQAKAA